jgi:hypothetical protein
MKKKTSGSSLAAVMITVSVFSALLGVVVTVTRTQTGNSSRTATRSQAIAYGDGIVESLFDQWRDAMITATDQTDRLLGRSTAQLQAMLAAPDTASYPAPSGISLVSWSVTAATPMLTPSTQADGRPTPEQGATSRLRMRLYYNARVEVSYTNANGTDNVVIERPFIRGGRNLFDNFYFGTVQETEFHPGAPMYVDGPVYAGGNLYSAHDFLTFLSNVSFLGEHFINYRKEDSRYGNTDPTIDNAPSLLTNNWDQNSPPRHGHEEKLFDTKTEDLDKAFLDDPNSNDVDSDGNKNNDGYHELIETPSTGSDPLQLDPSTSERLSENADYRIVVDASNNVVIYRGKDPTPLSTGDQQYVALRNSLILNTALKDPRESGNTRVVSLDVGALKTVSEGASRKVVDNVGGGDGLLLYIQDTSVGTSVNTVVKNSATGATTNVTSAKTRGVKLINGGKLPAGGLTIATPNTLYIQGDYNSGKTSTVQPPSNTTSTYTPPANKPSPQAAGYERVPAAVAADAVNILSNAWNDANSLSGIANRVASNTTVNTAVIAGSVPSKDGAYSGGIENFVRFHENWSGKYFTIYGTLALLYNSQQAKGIWGNADYNPPNRRWYYDTKFQDANPPGFQVARVYERGRWTRR